MISAIGQIQTVSWRDFNVLGLYLSMTDFFISAAQRHVNYRYGFGYGVFFFRRNYFNARVFYLSVNQPLNMFVKPGVYKGGFVGNQVCRKSCTGNTGCILDCQFRAADDGDTAGFL
ncbi:hypothetical protein [Thalassolituus alkanivorans]|uniref:hypothetical protein n=1 Tax=Thalassolituus alkanivorans TaxID=2881055 RepID=UPI001E46BF7F|nr:hypothetical protein [Thalassolituus alkanivorans]MCB2386822.1 hypothetical protein [Thalassolituus alkanivorans]MCB2424543.1 hypothetical protein [Thalassolituus alkanivorans]